MSIRWIRIATDELIGVAARHRVLAVTAVAGWGKTAVIAPWAQDRPTVWVSAPETGAEAADWLSAQVPDAGDDGVVLVVDDLHRVRPGTACALFLEDLCLRPPSGLSIVLLSRVELPFDPKPLRRRGFLAELGAPELALGIPSVAAVVHSTVGEDPPELAARVWAATGGWPAAVRYAVDMLVGVEPDRRIEVLAGLTSPGTAFHNYLTTRVIAHEDPSTQELLRRIAVGDIGAVDEDADTAELLDALSRRGLLWPRTGTGTGTPARRQLLPPLAEYIGREEVVARTLRLLVATGDHRACAELLVEHGDDLVAGGHANAVLEVLELPADHIDDPRLQKVLGIALHVRGQWRAAESWLRRAAGSQAELPADLAWRLCALAFVKGDFHELRGLIERTRFDAGHELAQLRVLFFAACTHRAVGDLDELKVTADRVVRLRERCEGPLAEVVAHFVLAMQCVVVSDRRAADAHSTAAMAAADRSGQVLASTWLRTSRAVTQLEQGDPGSALIEAEAALAEAERLKTPFFVAQALTIRGRARLRLGSLELAQTDLSTAANLFQDLGSRFLAWPLSGLGDLYRSRGQLMRARAAYEEALALAEPGHEVLGLGAALIGLARIRAVDDTAVARAYADRAVNLGEALRMVPAYLARGWVALLDGNRESAAADAALAAEQARQRHDQTGMAEAISLRVLAVPDPAGDSGLLREAIDIWQETGCRPEGAAAGLVAASIGVAVPGLSADEAAATLRACGLDPQVRRGAGSMDALSEVPRTVAIHTLGVFRVTRNGVAVPHAAWQSRKARDLLKILVSRRRPVPRDQLMELLWPDTDPSKSGNRLSVLLSTVRDVLQPVEGGAQPLATDGTAVWLDPALVTVDVEEFRKVATRALDAHRCGHPDAANRLATAASRYTGKFLEDDPYADWAQHVTEELRALHQSVLRALIDHRQARGDVDEVVRHTLRLLEDDPYDEQAHVNLVKVLLAAGRIGEAHRRYGIYRRHMKDMDVEPQPMPE
jgi:DNA-binding SARP family transcriptional activator